MKCPNCGEDNCHFITNTENHMKGFGMSEACCGMLLLGPLGILCGLCGMESESKTKEFWICDSCGCKFSQSEIKRFMEEENNKLKKFLFYREVQSQTTYDTYTNRFGELVRIAEEQYLNDMNREQKIIRSNPPFENQKFELMKSKCSSVLTEKDLVYLVIMEGNGVVIADKGIVFADVFMENINNIRCYENCVYVRQICVRMTNREHALAMYKFLDYLYNSGRKPIPDSYNSYDEFLKELQKNEIIDNKRVGHFSSQPEYQEYVNKIFEKSMRHFALCDPGNYEEYIKRVQEYEVWDNKSDKYSWISLAVSIIIGYFAGIIAGIILFVILAIIIGVIDSRKKQYVDKILPEYLLEVLEERNREQLEKTGRIRAVYYEDLLKRKGNVTSSSNFCSKCGSKLKEGVKFCPFCGKQQ